MPEGLIFQETSMIESGSALINFLWGAPHNNAPSRSDRGSSLHFVSVGRPPSMTETQEDLRLHLIHLATQMNDVRIELSQAWVDIERLTNQVDTLEEWASAHDTIIPARYRPPLNPDIDDDKPPCVRHVDRRPPGLKGFSPSRGCQSNILDY